MTIGVTFLVIRGDQMDARVGACRQLCGPIMVESLHHTIIQIEHISFLGLPNCDGKTLMSFTKYHSTWQHMVHPFLLPLSNCWVS